MGNILLRNGEWRTGSFIKYLKSIIYTKKTSIIFIHLLINSIVGFYHTITEKVLPRLY